MDCPNCKLGSLQKKDRFYLCDGCHLALHGSAIERITELEADNNEFKEFVCHLKDSAKGFTEDLEATDDLISTFDSFFVSYDDVIQACGGGVYGNDPLELIGCLHNKITELEGERDRQYDQNVEQIKKIAKLEQQLKQMEWVSVEDIHQAIAWAKLCGQPTCSNLATFLEKLLPDTPKEDV